MEQIPVELHDKVAVLKMNKGVTNAVDPGLLTALAEELERLRTDTEVTGVVLTSANNKFFSIGLDIPILYHLPEHEFWEFFHAFNSFYMGLYTYPKPVVAAINGHAAGAGCIFALSCDYRFIAQGKKLLSLPELELGLPVPYPAHSILRELVGARHARDMAYSCRYYPPEESLEMGLVDGILSLDELLPGAVEKARELGRQPSKAFGIIKRNRTLAVEEQVNRHMAEKEQLFLECWCSQTAREKLKELIKKF